MNLEKESIKLFFGTFKELNILYGDVKFDVLNKEQLGYNDYKFKIKII